MADTLTGFPDFFRYAVWQLLQTCGGSIGSGSRTKDEQAGLLASKGAWTPDHPGAAAPGTSNHEVGVGYGAADLEGNLDCMHANAAKFGLHFPMDNEPWHIEPTKELIDQGMAFFGLESGMDPNAAQPEADDPMARAIRLLEGDDDPDIVEGPTTGPMTAAMPGELNQPDKVKDMTKDKDMAKADLATAPKGKDASAFSPEASAGFTPGGGSMAATEVATVLAQAGFTGEALVNAVAISMGESGWDPRATGDTSLVNGTWGPSMGLMQIRSVNAERGTGSWRDADRLYDPLFNAKAAFAISSGGTDFGPWTVWTKGIYKQYLDEARAAVSAIGGGGAAAPTPQVPETPAETREVDDLLTGFEGSDIVSDPTTDLAPTRDLAPEGFASA